jgi:hypothetical protein
VSPILRTIKEEGRRGTTRRRRLGEEEETEEEEVERTRIQMALLQIASHHKPSGRG